MSNAGGCGAVAAYGEFRRRRAGRVATLTSPSRDGRFFMTSVLNVPLPQANVVFCICFRRPPPPLPQLHIPQCSSGKQRMTRFVGGTVGVTEELHKSSV